MSTFAALVLTLVLNGQVYEDVPLTFVTMNDCQNFVDANNLDSHFFSL